MDGQEVEVGVEPSVDTAVRLVIRKRNLRVELAVLVEIGRGRREEVRAIPPCVKEGGLLQPEAGGDHARYTFNPVVSASPRTRLQDRRTPA